VFKLLKGGHCYVPAYTGINDVLVVRGKIFKIQKDIPENYLPEMQVIDCRNKIICPGFIDQHVHIIGGGGEDGPFSRVPEVMLGELFNAGITTLVGLLGVDGITRSITGLLAKARALEAEGITTFIYTGSYTIPPATITGKVMTDIAIIDKVIGIGEIAISDHRSAHPTLQQLRELASETRVGGLLGGKAGVMHIHLGDGKEGLVPLIELIRNSDFPLDMFVPTHLNRNRRLLNQALDFAMEGGNIDLTAGEVTGNGLSVPDALTLLLNKGVDIKRITVSSDANGSIPGSDGRSIEVGKAGELLKDIRTCITINHLDVEDVLKTVTCNAAARLGLYPGKGTLACGSDADILVLDKDDLTLKMVIANGDICVENGILQKKGRFEH
jgi:beta-aspartyl-dipeptidase (metallo-type)